MTQITLSAGQVAQLHAASPLVECRDSTGNLVGYLHLAGHNAGLPAPEFSPEQLAGFEQEPGGRSLEEILSDLRKRR
jgi:hypothetical protein